MASKKSDCLTIEAWNPQSIHYQQPKKSKVGKDIYLSSTQLNSRLTLQSPLMKTWGISDYIDEKGNAQGRYSMSLNFQNEGYSTPELDLFKTKLQEFQNKILQDAYDNRLAWFGDDELSFDVIKSKMIPILKYSKLKDDKGQKTKKSDLTKAPTISLKVSNYDNKWGCEVYDMDKNKLFPSDNPNETPIDFVTKGSEVITKFQCGCIWTGDMMWGVKWNLVLCFVKESEKYNTFDISNIVLPSSSSSAPKQITQPTVSLPYVENSDDEEEEEIQKPVANLTPTPIVVAAVETPVVVQKPLEEVAEEEDEPEPVVEKPKIVKKIIKKTVVK